MLKLTACAVSLALWTSPAAAQTLFFPDACAEIVFFAPCPSRPASWPNAAEPARPTPPSERAQKPSPEDSVFAEPQVAADGTVRVYLPPKPVRDFLEHPTPGHARAYRQWNAERLEKLLAAQAVLDQVSGVPSGISARTGASPRAEGTASAPSAPSTRQPTTPGVSRGPRGSPAGTTEVLYLLATWCPYCARQTPILAEFARAHSEIRIHGIALESEPDTIAPYAADLPFPIRQGTDDEKAAWGVRAYPTLLIFQDGAPTRRITGLTSLAALEQAVGIAGGPHPPSER